MRRSLPLLLLAMLGAPVAAQTPALKDPPATDRIAALVRRLAAPYLADRQEARNALEKLGGEAVPAVIQALGDDDFRVRSAACQILGRLKSEAAIPRIVELLDDAEASVQEAALQALLDIGPAGAAHVEKARREGRIPEEAYESLRRAIQRAVEERLNACITAPVPVSDARGLRFVYGCGFFKGQFREVEALGATAVPALLKLFTSSPQDYEFAFTFDDEAGEARQFGLDTRKRIVQHLAGEALGEMRDRSVVPALKKFLDDLGDVNPLAESDARLEPYETAAFVLLKLGEPFHFVKLKEQFMNVAGVKIDASGATTIRSPGGPAERQSQIRALSRLALLQIKADELEVAERTYVQLIDRLKQGVEAADGGPVAPGGPASQLQDMLPNAYYNLACAYAQMNKKREALQSLAKAIDTGYQNVHWMQRDGDLEAIRGEPEYRELVGRLGRQKAGEASPTVRLVPRPQPPR